MELTVSISDGIISIPTIKAPKLEAITSYNKSKVLDMKRLNTLLVSYSDLKSFNFKKRIKNGPSVDELNLSQSTQ
jgi:hypothetical protein